MGKGLGGMLVLVLALALAPGASAAPGSPGDPGPPATIFEEGFENVTNPAVGERLDDYTGDPPTSMTYTAHASWLNEAVCNGIIASYNSLTGSSGCAAGTYNTYIRPLGKAIGAVIGGGDDNQVMADVTAGGSSAATPAATLQTESPIPLSSTNRFITFSIDAAATACTAPADPLLRFYLVDGATEIPVTVNAIDACDDPRGTTVSGAAYPAGPVRVGSYATDGSVLFSSSSLGIKLTNDQTGSSGNDYAVDNLRVLDATPQLDKEFESPVASGVSATLRFTITNTSDLAAKEGWSFTDNLPAGLEVASPAGASTNCTNGSVTAAPGSSTIGVEGDLETNRESCTASVEVVADESGSYENCPEDLSDVVGLDPPACDTLVVVPPGPIVSCTSDPNVFNTGYNAATGGVLPNGSNDANWQVAGPFPPTDPLLESDPPPASAVFGPPVVGKQAGSWANSPYGNAQWISQPGTGASNGDWYYRFPFTLDPAVDPDQFSLQMNFLADNTVAEVYVNDAPQSGPGTGLPQGSGNPYFYPGFFLANAAETTLDSNWQTGLNIIVVHIKSFGPAEGFLAQIRPSAVCPVDLAVAKTASSPTYRPGQTLTYTVEVTNGGPGVASGLAVSDPLPGDLEGAAWTCTATTGSSCEPNGSGDIDDVPAGAYPGPSIAPGGTLTYTVTGTVSSTASERLSNTATVTPPTGTDDPGCDPDCSATAAVDPLVTDLRLTKAATTAVDPGDPVTYTLTVHNDGPDDSSGSTVTDTLPDGLTSISAPASCVIAGQTVTCEVGALASGASTEIEISADAPDTPATCFENDATVEGLEVDPNTDNDDASVRVCTTPVADLELTKETSPALVDPGEPFAYFLTIRNNGPNTSSGSTVTDTLPDGVVLVAFPDDDCDVAGQTITCDVGPLTTTEALGYTFLVEAPDTPATCFENTASIEGDDSDPAEGDPDLSNNGDTARTCTTPAADLALEKAAPAVVDPGGQVTWTLTVTNNGPQASSGSTVRDTLPAGITNIEAPGCEVAGPTVTCEVGALAAEASTDIEITGDAPNTADECFENDAAVEGNEGDPDLGNNEASVETCTNAGADLELTKAASDGPHFPSDEVTYTLTVTNNGPATAHDVSVSDNLPAGLTLVSATPSQGTCDDADPLSCELGTIAPEATVTITVVATIGLSRGGEELENFACVEGSRPDPSAANDCDAEPIDVDPLSDLEIEKAAPEAADVGEQFDYVLTATNNGPSGSDQTVITDTLPAGLDYVSDDAGCDTASLPELTCDLGSLGSGAEATVRITVEVLPAAASTVLDNVAAVSGPSADSNPGNNEDEARTLVPPLADLSVTKNAPTAVDRGGRITYTLEVRNDGPTSSEPETTLTDTLPGNLTYVSDDAGCDTANLPEITCELGPLASGASRTVRIVAEVKARATGTLTNSARISGPIPDPDEANNEDQATTRILVPQLKMTKRAGKSSARPGEVLAYRMTLRNTGEGAALNVRVCDQLPKGLRLLRAPGANAKTKRKACWRIKTLAAGAKRTFRVVAQVEDDVRRKRLRNVAIASGANAPKVKGGDSVGLKPVGGSCPGRARC